MTEITQRPRLAPGEIRRRVIEEVTTDCAYLKEMTLEELQTERTALAANLALLRADIAAQDPVEPQRGRDWLRRARHGAIYAKATLGVCTAEIEARQKEIKQHNREESQARYEQQKAARIAAHQKRMQDAIANRKPKNPPPAPNPEKRQRQRDRIAHFVTVAHSMLPEETIAAIWTLVKLEVPDC
jgi:ribosomal protein L29